MDRDELFVRTYDELAELAFGDRDDEYTAMRMAGLLRRLLIDDDPLVHQVNRGRRLRLRVLAPFAKSLNEDDLPLPPPAGAPPFVRGVKEVTIDELLSRFAFWAAPHEYSVRDAIKYVANIKGDVHAGKASDDLEAVLVDTGDQVKVGGHDPAVYSLYGIAQVVLVALRPLREAIKPEA